MLKVQKMKLQKLSIFFLVPMLLLIFSSCNKSEKKEGSIYFRKTVWKININEQVTLDLRVNRGGDKSNYDLSGNPFNLKWSVTDKDILSVNQKGVVTGKEGGTAFVKVASKDGKYSASTQIVVVDDKLLESVSQPLSPNLIYSKGVYLIRNSVIQSFDIDSKGDIFYDQLGGHLQHFIFVIKGKPNQPFESSMKLRYFGHGTNMAVEEDGKDRYIWINSNGTKKTDGNYGSNRTFSRVKYVPDTEVKSYVDHHTYYLPGKTNIHPALDIENDILAVTTSGGGDPLRYFYIFKLSEAKSLPETEVELPAITFGGEDGGPPEETVKRKIKVKDLSQLTPISSFSVSPGANYNQLNSYAFQGFDVDDGRIYFYEGEGNDNTVASGPSNAFVTVIDYMSGKVVGNRTRVKAISNIPDLDAMGVTATGYMEAEGIKVHNGDIYLGYASKSTDNKRRANIFVYKK